MGYDGIVSMGVCVNVSEYICGKDGAPAVYIVPCMCYASNEHTVCMDMVKERENDNKRILITNKEL